LELYKPQFQFTGMISRLKNWSSLFYIKGKEKSFPVVFYI
jgi:hypothetical protein